MNFLQDGPYTKEDGCKKCARENMCDYFYYCSRCCKYVRDLSCEERVDPEYWPENGNRLYNYQFKEKIEYVYKTGLDTNRIIN